MNIPLESIMAVVAVSESGSFSSAARKLNKSQAAISIAIQGLESILGYSLYIRNSRGVEPTQKGELYYKECKRLVDEHRRFSTVTKNISHKENKDIVIGLDDMFSTPAIDQIFHELLTSFPDLKFSVRFADSAQLMDMYGREELDFAVGYFPRPGTDYHLRLFDAQWLWVCRSVLAQKNLSSARLYLPASASLLGLADQGLESRVHLVTSLRYLLSLCKMGQGAIYVPYHHVASLVESNDLSVIPHATGQDVFRTTLLIKPGQKETLFGEWFVNKLQSVKGQIYNEPKALCV